MAVGNTLRDRRKQRGLTVSEAAAGTRLKMQVVEALENEQYNRIPAPIYVKGFLKLYAEYLGLDPQPLIDEYEAGSVENKPAVLENPAANEQPRPGRMERSTSGDEMELFEERQEPQKKKPLIPRIPRPKVPPLDTKNISEKLGKYQRAIRRESFNLFNKAESLLIHLYNTVRMRTNLLRDFSVPYWQKAAGLGGMVVVILLFLTVISQCIRRDAGRAILLFADGDPLNLAINPAEPYLDEPTTP